MSEGDLNGHGEDEPGQSPRNSANRRNIVPSDFLHPQSMMTPGACGAITMLIANTAFQQFGIAPAYSGLLISFLMATLIVATYKMKIIQRLIYGFLNGCIIFSVAAGSSGLANAGISPRLNDELADLVQSSGSEFVRAFSVRVAVAELTTQTQETTALVASRPSKPSTAAGGLVAQAPQSENVAESTGSSEQELRRKLEELEEKLRTYEKARQELNQTSIEAQKIYKYADEEVKKNLEPTDDKMRKMLYIEKRPFFQSWF